jgi:hypothetical protein
VIAVRPGRQHRRGDPLPQQGQLGGDLPHHRQRQLWFHQSGRVLRSVQPDQRAHAQPHHPRAASRDLPSDGHQQGRPGGPERVPGDVQTGRPREPPDDHRLRRPRGRRHTHQDHGRRDKRSCSKLAPGQSDEPCARRLDRQTRQFFPQVSQRVFPRVQQHEQSADAVARAEQSPRGLGAPPHIARPFVFLVSRGGSGGKNLLRSAGSAIDFKFTCYRFSRGRFKAARKSPVVSSRMMQ